jgi:hypothetical protein
MAFVNERQQKELDEFKKKLEDMMDQKSKLN